MTSDLKRKREVSSSAGSPDRPADTIDALRAELEKARANLGQAWAEADALRARLASLEGSVAFRAISLYWSLVNRFLPQGTRRRRAYEWLRRRGAAAVRFLLRILRAVLRRANSRRALPLAAEPARPAEFGLDVIHHLDATVSSDTAVAIFSGTQLKEDEGQRPTQICVELASRNVPVVFGYWRWGPGEWLPQDRLDQGIAVVPLDVLTSAPRALAEAFPGRERVALFTFPHPSFFEILATLNGAGWWTVYDVLDDWEEFHRVGQAIWYEKAFEAHLTRSVDAVVTVNSVLAERMRGFGASDPLVVPNGLRRGVERATTERALERGEVTVGYFGYLSPAWYDWDLLRDSARERPTWRFHIIGYGEDRDSLELPENVRLLGKVPQTDLASYAANWDVAIIPFKAEKLAAGADPIKTYEYLAMGLPVVTTGVSAPPGAEGVVRKVSADRVEFLAALETAAGQREQLAPECRAFAQQNTWGSRVDSIFELIRRRGQRAAEKSFLTGVEAE